MNLNKEMQTCIILHHLCSSSFTGACGAEGRAAHKVRTINIIHGYTLDNNIARMIHGTDRVYSVYHIVVSYLYACEDWRRHLSQRLRTFGPHEVGLYDNSTHHWPLYSLFCCRADVKSNRKHHSCTQRQVCCHIFWYAASCS